MSVLTTFNNQLINFSNSLVQRFPGNENLSFTNTSIKTLIKCNIKKPIELFTVHIYKYKDLINNCDEKKLLEINFSTDYSDYSKDSFNIMNDIKSCWKDLDSDEKKNIWNYLKVLIKLNEKEISNTIEKMK